MCACADDQAPLPEADLDLLVDDLGITHVFGRSDRDAMFGGGYAMARDRLFQMELVRRRALGTIAELLGPGSFGDDAQARTINFTALGQADAARLRAERPGDAALLEAWVAGVNQRLREVAAGLAPRPYGLRPTELDFIPAPWTLEDVHAIGKLLAFGLSNSLDAEILATAALRLAPDFAAHLSVLTPAYDVFIVGPPTGSRRSLPAAAAPAPLPAASTLPQRSIRGRSDSSGGRFFFPDFSFNSNNWAVDGAHTVDGRPLLAGDPHQGLSSPTRLWPVHLSSRAGGGSLDVIGFAFVGTPTVELGHNAHLAWTATTNFADVMDLWDVTVDSAFAQARIGAQTVPIVKRTEVIRMRPEGAPVGAHMDQPLDIHEVPGYGIFLPDEILPVPRSFLAQGRLLLNWTGFRATRESASYLGLDRARTLDELERAIDLLDVGAVNFIAADATAIDYYVHAAVPDRGDPAARPMPWHTVSGDDPASLWTRGDLPPEKLPHLRAPARGYLWSANNDPFGFTADGNVENDPFYYGAFYDKGFRAHRIEQALEGLLAGGRKAARADMEALQADVHSSLADALLPHLQAAVAAIGSDPALAPYAGRADITELAARLLAWDRRFARPASEPLIFFGWAWFATQRVFLRPVTPALFDAVASRSPPFLLGALRNVLDGRYPMAAFFLPDGERTPLVAALADTADWLKTRFGSLAPAGFAWQDVHFAAFDADYGGAALSSQVAVDGGPDTIDVAATPFFDHGQPADHLVTREMALYRMVVGFAEDGTPVATVDFARGTREDPADPHFADQQAAWLAAAHQPLRFRRADVEAVATECIHIPAAPR